MSGWETEKKLKKFYSYQNLQDARIDFISMLICSIRIAFSARCIKQIWKVGKVGKEGKVGKVGKVDKVGKVGSEGRKGR
jgi:hypothetical protein